MTHLSFFIAYQWGIITCDSDNFPEWKKIFIFAFMRLMHISSMRNVKFYFSTYFPSEVIKDAHVSIKSLDSMVWSTGMNRSTQINLIKNFMGNKHYLAVDLTHVLSMDIISYRQHLNITASRHLPQVQLQLHFTLSNRISKYVPMLQINSLMPLKTAMEENYF